MTAGGQEDGDGSGVNDWMRSGLNAGAPGPPPAMGQPAGMEPAGGGSSRGPMILLGAGLLSAALVGTTVVLSTIREDSGPAGSGSTTAGVTTSSSTTAYTTSSVPSTSEQTQSQSLDYLEKLDVLAADNATLAALVTDCRSGVWNACMELLDLLADDCHDGDLPSCDGLYWVSPVGSELETYGATCGGRVGSENAGRCAEQ